MRRIREKESSFCLFSFAIMTFFLFLGLGLGLLSAGKTGPIFSWVVSIIFSESMSMKRKPKKKNRAMTSVSMVYRWWDMVLISFVIDFYFLVSFVLSLSHPLSLFLTLSADPNQHRLFIWADSVRRKISKTQAFLLITFLIPVFSL